MSEEWPQYDDWCPVAPCQECGKPAYGHCPTLNRTLCPECHEKLCEEAFSVTEMRFISESDIGAKICGYADCIDTSFMRIAGWDWTYFCWYHTDAILYGDMND